VLEHRYGAVLLSHLLTGAPVPGLGDAVTPVRIRFQGRSVSRVDDIVVVGTAPNKREVVLSIGVRRKPKLVPSETESVKLIGDFLHVARAERALVDSGRWKLALAVVPSCIPAQQLKTLAEMASAAGSWTEFQDRLAPSGQPAQGGAQPADPVGSDGCLPDPRAVGAGAAGGMAAAVGPAAD
jgi:hypothetical protein